MLIKLLEAIRFEARCKVLVLMGRGTLSDEMTALGVEVDYIGMAQGAIPTLTNLFRIISIGRKFQPDIIQGWMYHGNVSAWFIKMFLSHRVRLLWNVRQSLYDLKNEKRLTRLLIGVSRHLSNAPKTIVYNSQVSSRQHEAAGYPHRSSKVIPNGFDLEKYLPDEAARHFLCNELELDEEIPVVLHVARYHPMKDHRSMLIAAALTLAKLPSVKFIFVGSDVTDKNEHLTSILDEFGLKKGVILLGERSDLSRLMAAADLLVSSSAWGEGFPNVVGEAMSCGTPCVVTDVGDSAHLVGDCGRVVPPCNPEALSAQIQELLSDRRLRNDLGVRARQRVEGSYSLQQVSRAYLNLYMGKGV